MTDAVRLRTSDLGRAADERGVVTECLAVGAGMVELTLRLPRLARMAVPGEFAQLRCAPGIVPMLRRPMSVAWTDGDRCTFVLEVVGVGTRLLAALRPGDHIDVLGPLGVGFHLPAGARQLVCVAGGLGCAPFPLAARSALDAGVERVTILHGAATAARLYPAERLRRGHPRVRVLEATDDGSRGHPGTVVDLLEAALAPGCDAVWACGPNPMLDALASALAANPAAPPVAEVSLEAPMGCGFGTCLGCALPVVGVEPGGEGTWALCCRQGPAMPAGSVDWDALRALPPARMA